ncbi:hypothetical protein ES703_47466 [subsurface metagenome]
MNIFDLLNELAGYKFLTIIHGNNVIIIIIKIIINNFIV